MARVIAEDKCINCGACEGDCPVGAIIEGDVAHTITDECIDCGACEGSCPVGAISEG